LDEKSVLEAVPLRDLEHGVLAEHAALDDGGERGGDDDAERTLLSRSPTTSSMVKVTAAMGALNAAAMPAAAPTGKRRRRLRGETPTTRPSMLAMPAQICTVGPSRPSDPPEPICNEPTTNLPTASRNRRRRPRCANAALT